MPYFQEKNKIAACFSRAVNTYDSACVLQRRVGEQLLSCFPQHYHASCILDVGSGTGYFSEKLAQDYLNAEIVSIDLSHTMLKKAILRSTAAVRWINADFDYVPLEDQMADIIYANMSFQWSLRLLQTFVEMNRLLKSNGWLLFSLPVAGSLHELMNSLKYLNKNAVSNQFVSPDTLMDALNESGYIDCDIRRYEHVMYYNDIYELLQSLKKTGANRIKYHSPTFRGKRYFDLLDHIYRREYGDQIKATYCIAYVKVKKGCYEKIFYHRDR